MGRYRKIDPRIHNDAKFKALSERGKLLFFTILTHPHMTALGASGREAGCASDCQAGRAADVFESYRQAFRDLIKNDLIKFDQANACLVIPKFLKYNPPESPSVVKAWNAASDLIPECHLRDELIVNTLNFLREYVEREPDKIKKEKKKSFLKAFLLRPSNPQAERQTAPQADGQGGAQQEQEQEQEQELNPPLVPPKGDSNKDFEEFWAIYPKKVGKQAALNKWKSLKKNKRLPPLATVLNAVTEQRTWEQWQKEDGQFIPNPATWLNQGRWDDKPSELKEIPWYDRMGTIGS
jgi:hypothetical protein